MPRDGWIRGVSALTSRPMVDQDTAAARRTTGYLFVVGAASAWALIGVFTRELADTGMTAGEVATWRALLGGACFVVHFIVRPSARRTPDDGPLPLRAAAVPLAAFALIGVTVFFASLPLAIEAGGITIAYVLMYTAPAWVAIGAAIFLRERLGPVDIGLVAVSVAGAALVSTATGNIDLTAGGVFWGLVAGLSYASYYLLGRRLFERLGAVATYAICLPAGGILLAVIVRPAVPASSAVPWLVALAVGSTWLPYLSLSAGLARVESSRAVVVATLEPVIAAAIAASFYDERLAAAGWFGAALIVTSAAISATRR